MMGLSHWKTRGGLVARPESHVDYMFELEEQAMNLNEKEFAYEIGERIGIMLDGADEDFLRELSETYGRQRLGGYFVE